MNHISPSYEAAMHKPLHPEHIARQREVDARWTAYHHPDTERIVREVHAKDDLDDFMRCENALTATVRAAAWLLCVPVLSLGLLALLQYLGW